jgi:hypothetical protein
MRSYLEKRFGRSKEQLRNVFESRRQGHHPFLRHQSVFWATILASDELTGLGMPREDGKLLPR